MKNIKTVVLGNSEVAAGYYRMKILAPGYVQHASPGQFVMLRIQQNTQPLLRRPFGVFRTGFLPAQCNELQQQEFVELIYKVVGSGTSLMSTLQDGDCVELLGPLGSGFEILQGKESHLLVGGGIGLAPLYMLAERLCKEGKQVRLLMGGGTRDDILCITEFERLGVETYVATDDGSLGESGFVTKVLERKLTRFPDSAVYACGPNAMLSAVRDICCAANVPLQVSLEALMACGVGACLGCVVPGKEHSEQQPEYLCTCRQGPVFSADQLSWQSQGGQDGE